MYVAGAKRGKRDWFWFYFCLVEKVAQDFLANHKALQCKTKGIKKIAFDSQIKSAVIYGGIYMTKFNS